MVFYVLISLSLVALLLHCISLLKRERVLRPRPGPWPRTRPAESGVRSQESGVGCSSSVPRLACVLVPCCTGCTVVAFAFAFALTFAFAFAFALMPTAKSYEAPPAGGLI